MVEAMVRVVPAEEVTVDRARCEVERALVHEELVDILLDTLRVRGTLKPRMDEESWSVSMTSHVKVAERLEAVQRTAERVVGVEERLSWDSSGRRTMVTRVALVEKQVAVTLMDLATVDTAEWEACLAREVDARVVSESVGVLGDWQSDSDSDSPDGGSPGEPWRAGRAAR
jgi:hypothetical protein